MNSNLLQLIQQFNQFKQQIRGQDPQKMLNDLLSSGRYSQSQVDEAKRMAQQLQQFMK